ncbi:alr0857 family protein [Leptothoe sp. PORK10 BA2]|uniref:alr0857 family protein n=1 Tax=Leptothoe sp. PORK10 BA2 TaxID=3110254 RepID=UPI002B1FA2FA|nr:alr0857 family protein [Leptothoe sp. PORK10 BA2]MEA5466291.1 hypothetical protein [Leptothoe sp. PORK10 BA2]
MLKLNYTDCGLFVETIAASSDVVAIQRVMLAMSIGEPFHLEPSRASFLLPVETLGMTCLESMLKTDTTDTIDLTPADEECVEVSLKGTWMANSSNAESGTFISVLAPELERLIYQLWQGNQFQTAY